MPAATKTILLLLFLALCCIAKAQRYSVIIHEIMADPQPVVRLPDAEYIELKNRSSTPVSLKDWRLQTNSSTSSLFPDYVLQPDSFLVITSRSNNALFASPVIGISSFPSLSNTGTTLVLLNDTGAVVHAVAYNKSWYGNRAKEEGGWSLEMTDASSPCSGSNNWKASTDASGGTPGKANAVADANKDNTPPVLLNAIAKDNISLLLHFDESLSPVMSLQNFFRISPTVSTQSASLVPPLFNQVLIQLQQPLQPQTLYTISVNGIADCAGNEIGVYNKVQTGLPETVAAGDVIINEILFNPRGDGSDYVELYNRSKKVIDISRLRIKGTTNTVYKISDDPLYILPQTYAVLTENRSNVLRDYLAKNPAAVVEVSSLPPLPDDAGIFILMNEAETIIDALHYKDDWHHALIANASGVALERISFDAATQDKNNWASAAATAGFGTPTYQNSQYGLSENAAGNLAITPKVFSPDGDGFDDLCVISFDISGAGWVANLRIFDAAGKQVRHLVKSETLAASNTWRWDGLGENKKSLLAGAYIVWLEMFNLKGEKQMFKKVAVLAGKKN